MKRIINLLLLSHFYPVMYHTDEFKKKGDELLYTVWSLVMVREPVANVRG